MIIELGAAAGGSYAFYKFIGPLLYNECFAATDDIDELVPPPSERSPLLKAGVSPASLRLAAQLYSAHVSVASSSASPSLSGRSSIPGTPVSTAPSSPASHSSSYFDLKQPPLYLKDVSVALEKETKRRNSAEYQRANVLAAFNMSSTTDTHPPRRPSFSRGFSSSSTVASSASGPRTKTFSDETSYLTAALICLLHCPDLNDFFLAGKYLDEDVQDKQHRAVIDAFAATTNFFWPPVDAPLSIRKQSLDLSVFHALFHRSAKLSASSAATPLSSSPMSSSPLSSSTLVNAFASSAGTTSDGAQTVSHLLRSLHVALNEGEYTAEQPTYLREPFRLGGKQSDEGEGFRKHVGFLRNMTLIQEDSVVRDLFEGLCCVKVRCGTCDETVVAFESFLALPLPSAGNTLSAMLKAYEKSSTTTVPQYCAQCRSYQHHTETRKIWSLPSVLVFQLPTTASTTSSTSRPAPNRRMSSSTSRSSATASSDGIAYPVTGLNMAKFDGEQRSSTGRTPSPSASEYDLSAESDSEETPSDQEEVMYDLFAVRESVRQGKSYRTFAKDPTDDAGWSSFDAATGVARDASIREIVTPNADLLFYRRRED